MAWLCELPSFLFSLPTPADSVPDISSSGFKAEAIASYLKARANLPSLDYVRPVDKGALALNVLSVVAGAIAIWRLWPFASIIFGRRYIWAASSLVRPLFSSDFPSFKH